MEGLGTRLCLRNVCVCVCVSVCVCVCECVLKFLLKSVCFECKRACVLGHMCLQMV